MLVMRLVSRQRVILNFRSLSSTTFPIHSLATSEADTLTPSLTDTSLTNPTLSPPLTIKNMNYPWLLSYEKPRIPPPSLWASIKSRHILKAAVTRAHGHLQEPAYQFPEDFLVDAKVNIRRLFEVLSTGRTIDSVSHIMTKSLASSLIPAHNDLLSRGAKVIYTPRSSTYTLSNNPIIVSLKSINYTYGPYPAPLTHAPQRFYNLLTLILPLDPRTNLPQEFESYDHQVGLLNTAMSQGCYMRISTLIKTHIKLLVQDTEGKTVVEDVREEMQAEFVSPHFCSADEIFEMNEDGTWRLGFEWRISDLDYLVRKEREGREAKEALEGRMSDEMARLGFGDEGRGVGLQKVD